jgi:hypothetical protein
MITTEPKQDSFCVLCRLSYRSSGNETVAPINVPSRDDHHIMSRVSYRGRASVHSAWPRKHVQLRLPIGLNS